MSLFTHQATKEDDKTVKEIIMTAQKRAERIVEIALKESESMIGEFDEFKTQMKGEMKGVFDKSTATFSKMMEDEVKDFVKSTGDLLPAVKQYYVNSVNESVQFFKQELLKQITPVMKSMDQLMLDVREDFRQRMEGEWAKTQKELEEYKKQQKQYIERQVEEKVKVIAEKVFHDHLSPVQQEQFVIDALEKAKKDGIFEQ